MKINISRVAMLASLPIPTAEKDSLDKQLEATLDHVNRLKKIDTSKVEETNQVNNLVNIWREDVVKPSLSQEDALMNAKNTYKGFFVVPVILAEVAG
jgi:aspartyl-tRNA(Asn)/glutamyl-tRNA(Gln) amidotransferase subunit C